MNDTIANVQPTPGPWAMEDNVMAGGINHFAVTNRSNGDEWMVCSITPMQLKRDVDEANARLIAAAPELLAQLRAAKGQLESAMRDFAALVEVTEACFSTNAIRSRQGSTLAKLAAVNCERAMNNASAIIAKATGGEDETV